jgi:competence protein ComEA
LIFSLTLLKFHVPPASTGAAFSPEELVVEITGDVDEPGIYLFHAPPTLGEVLGRAGGWEGGPGELLRTGTLLTVGRTANGDLRIHTGRMEARKLLVFFIPLDLNRASVEDLCLIPGVGESLARDIVTYREKRKGFRTVGELRQVKGIGETKWEALREYVTVQ